MGFSINASSLPSIRSYAHAVARESAIKPIRGRTLKPAGDRRAQHMQVEKQGENIVFQLYGTDCVTYYPDGRIRLNHSGYNTQSTAKFLNAICPYGMVCLRGGFMILQTGGADYQIPREGLYIQVDNGPEAYYPGVTVVNPLPFVVHEIDRKATRPVRAKYAAFKKYAVGMCKLMDGATANVSGRFLPVPDCSGDTDEGVEVWARAALAFMALTSKQQWCGVTRTWGYRTTPQAVSAYIDKSILRKHKDEVFTTRTLPAGEYKKDTYKSYFA